MDPKIIAAVESLMHTAACADEAVQAAHAAVMAAQEHLDDTQRIFNEKWAEMLRIQSRLGTDLLAVAVPGRPLSEDVYPDEYNP